MIYIFLALHLTVSSSSQSSTVAKVHAAYSIYVVQLVGLFYDEITKPGVLISVLFRTQVHKFEVPLCYISMINDLNQSKLAFEP